MATLYPTSDSASGLFRPKNPLHRAAQQPDRPQISGPSDSSVARMRWADDGGPCEPLSDRPCISVPAFRLDSGDEPWREKVELISLPFAEYSAAYPERLEWLRSRLKSESLPSVRYLVVDVTRVCRPGGLLLGVLHAAAARLLKGGRCLVLAGDLSGLVSVSNLTRLCHVAVSREAAFAWCQEQLTD
ncbi:MAG: hypothetical protein O3B68_16305 [Planctomycetota bacterium]|nr:hypothetical protein [Planctomycetota bacterium]